MVRPRASVCHKPSQAVCGPKRSPPTSPPPLPPVVIPFSFLSLLCRHLVITPTQVARGAVERAVQGVDMIVRMVTCVAYLAFLGMVVRGGGDDDDDDDDDDGGGGDGGGGGDDVAASSDEHDNMVPAPGEGAIRVVRAADALGWVVLVYDRQPNQMFPFLVCVCPVVDWVMRRLGCPPHLVTYEVSAVSQRRQSVTWSPRGGHRGGWWWWWWW
jgi:hypothetical protein